MDLPTDATELMTYFRQLYPEISEPRHLPETKGGPAVIIGGRHRKTGKFFHIPHHELRQNREFYSIDNDFWWNLGPIE